MGRLATPVIVLCISILATAVYAPAQSGGGTPQPPGDTLFSRPHDVYPDELMKQMPRPGKNGFPLSPGGTQLFSYPNVNISVDTFPQNEPSVKISRKHPNRVVAAWRDFRTGVSPAIRRVGYSLSTDGGSTWSVSALLPIIDSVHLRASDPAVGTDSAGNFYIATISVNNTNNDGKILVFKSTDEGATFGEAHVAPSIPGSAFDDKEYIVCDLNPASPFANSLYISWTRFGTPAGIQLTKSVDGGITWTPPVQVSDGTNVQGSDPAVGPNGDLYVVWAGPGVMFDKSTNGGTTFGTDSVLSTMSLHGFPSIAVDLSGGARNGTIYVSWADARNGDDDVFLRSSTNGGQSWSPAARVNDDPLHDNKLQYWPWLAVDDQGTVSIVYNDTRNTGDNSIFEAYLARSTDGGQSFINQRLSAQPSPSNTPNSDVRFGDYIGIDSWGGRYVPVWTDERAGGFNMDIYTAIVKAPQPATIPVSVATGWNLVSLPAFVNDRAAKSLFPLASSPAFSYAGSYLLADSMKYGNGYWLKYPSDQTVTIHGDSLALDSIPAFAEWNLVGSISAPVPVASIGSNPPGIIVSRVFGYSGGYHVVDTVKPGAGSWIKTSSPGKLVLSQGPAKRAEVRSASAELAGLDRLTISDASGSCQTLYFGPRYPTIDAGSYDLPPVPPAPMFDARFASGRMVQLFPPSGTDQAPILLTGGVYPLSVRWESRLGSATLRAGGQTVAISGVGSARIAQPPERVLLAYSPRSEAGLPAETRLEQNYPNPFNPSTTISYSLGRESHVTLKIFDLLGREVAALIDGRMAPGSYTARWDASSMPGGIYYCVLRAGGFAQTRTMTLVR